jgi:endonuclease/exonuclease/phosphatase family metal-dependent hydrolase
MDGSTTLIREFSMRRLYCGARDPIVAIGLGLCLGTLLIGCSRHRQEAIAAVAGRIDSAAAPAARNDLRVMTFNVRVRTFIDLFDNWTSRRDLLAQTVRQSDPDILGTQECLAEQSDYLRQELADYDFVGVGRDDGDRRGEMCALFFRRDRFEKIDAGHFWLSQSPDVPGSRSWGSAYTRMATWVKLRQRGGGPTVCIVNTHFDVFSARARLESARLVRSKIQSLAAGLPCIVMGDFNDSPGSEAYRELLVNGIGPAMADAFRASNPISSAHEGTRHDFSGRTTGPRIDWIVVSREFQSVESSIVHASRNGKYPSDHFPVTAVLKLASDPITLAR